MADDDFLRRWSRRKAEAKRAPETATEAPPPAVVPAPTPDARPAVAASTPTAASPTPALPDPASLEPGADVSAFMARGVDEALKRRALKSLFQDPRFNVMDGLDVYIDDYSIPDPMPPEWLDKLEQLSHLGDRAERDRAAEAREALAADGAVAERSGPVVGEAGDATVQQPESIPPAGANSTPPVSAPETSPLPGEGLAMDAAPPHGAASS